jgi:hypothetical protein
LRITWTVILTAGGTLCHPLLPAGLFGLDASIEFSFPLIWRQCEIGAD